MFQRATVILAVLLAAGSAVGDEVVFKNGDRLTGRIETMADGKLTIASVVAGSVTVGLDQVRTFRTDAPILLILSDGTFLYSAVVPDTDGRVAIEETEALQGQSLALANVKAINPPPKPGPKWKGNVSAGYTFTAGNTETDALNLDISLARRSERDRVTLKGGVLYAREKDDATGDREPTTEKWFGEGKYDYFFTKKFYGFANARVEQDRIANLDARVLLGGGPGYQWIENDVVKFGTEAGLAWRYEKFTHQPGGESSMSGQAGSHFELSLNDKAKLLHDLTYYPSLEKSGDFFITSTAELRLALTERLFTGAKLKMDHDSKPPAGTKRTDWLYLFNLGINLF